jgi:DNA-binding IclR family transcriptional regulator
MPFRYRNKYPYYGTLTSRPRRVKARFRAAHAPSTVGGMSSWPAERVVQILDFLTTHPGQGFTLSELSRRLRISKTTAHNILGTLTARALVVRSSDSFEYRLGPALVPMGIVAERVLPALTYARQEADALADEHDAECVVVMTTGDELLIVHHAGVPGPLSTTFQEGQRQPLAPPMGTVALAWAGPEAVEAWLHRLGPELTEAERERYRAAVAAVRRQGYAIGIRVARLYDLHELYANADLHSAQGRHDLGVQLAAFARHTDLPASEDLPPDAEISGVAAPVFGPDGTMLLAIALTGTDYRVRDIPALSWAVMRAAGRVMAATDGRRPPARRDAARGPTAARRAPAR